MNQTLQDLVAMWVIYWNPETCPYFFVAREWFVLPSGAVRPSVNHHKALGTITDARQHIPAGMINLGRVSADDPAIYEVWV